MAININKIIKIFCVIITILIIIILSRGCDVIARIELNGNEEITLYQNSPFTDPGYNIIDDNGDYYVKVDSNINTNNVGIYQIDYSLYDKFDKYISTVTRKIIVNEDKNTDINMYLKGDEEEYFFLNEYVDHGIEVYNGNVDVTSDVNVISNVKPNVVGRYEVKYQIYSGSVLKEVIRKVNIIDYDIKEEINEIDLVINLTIECDDYYYTVLPSGKKIYSKYIDYHYNDIGEYNFDIYLKNGSHKKYITSINNIDKEGPNGICKLYYDNNQTTITITANDLSGISKYSYNGLEFYGNTTTINRLATNVIVKAYDKRNNYTDIICKAEYGLGFRRVNVTDDGRVREKLGYIKCNTRVSKESQELASLVSSYGYKTRGAVAASALYLATYKYDLPYFWGGKYVQKGFNPEWGCPHRVYGENHCTRVTGTSECEWGLDCTGLVSWAFAQAGFNYNVIRQDSLSEGSWGNFNARTHKYDFNKNNMYYINQIKPGDIVHREGHVGLVIGVDTSRIQIVEMLGPLFVSTLDKTTGRGLSKQKGFTDFVLMDEFYMMYGN